MTEEKVNIIKSVAETIDDIVNTVVGGRPVTRIINIVESIGPAKTLRKLGLPAPGDLVDRALYEIENAVKTGTLPREFLRKMRG